MKKCNKCSNIVNENDKFCLKCGNNDFTLEQTENKEEPIEFIYFRDGINPDGIGREVRYLNKSVLSNGPQEPKKDKKNSKVLGYIVAGLLLLIIVGMALTSLNDKSENSNNNDYEYEEENVEFTKGSIIDGIYQNEWADMSFDLKDGWEIKDKESDNEVITYGLSATKDFSTLTIAFVKTYENEENIDIYDYLEDYISGLKSAIENPVVIGPEYNMFGDHSYIYADVYGTANKIPIYFTSGMRRVNNYIVVVTASGITKESTHEIFNQITFYKNY